MTVLSDNAEEDRGEQTPAPVIGMKPIHTLMLVGVAAIWGFNFVASKYAVQSFAPFEGNAIRFLITFALLSPFFKRVPGQELKLMALAVLMGGLHFGLLFYSVARGADISALAITTQLNVPFSAILAVFLLRETVGWRRWAAITISFIGVVVMSFDPKVFEFWDAIGWTAFAAFCFGLGTVIMRSLGDVPAMTTQSWIALCGAISTIAISLLFEDGLSGNIANASTISWTAIIYSALFSSVLGHGCVNWMLQRYDVAMVTPYFLLMPVFAISGGWLFFDEGLTLQILTGGVLTMVGVTIVTLRNLKKEHTEKPAAPLTDVDP